MKYVMKHIQLDGLSSSTILGTLNGYGSQYKTYHPVFQTTNSEYGWTPPNAHTVPHRLTFVNYVQCSMFQ